LWTLRDKLRVRKKGERMTGKNDIKQAQDAENAIAEAKLEATPQRRRFWENIWFMLGTVVLTISVILALVNNTDTTINLLVATMSVKLPLLIIGSGILGVAVEYFIFLGPRADARAENRSLRKQVADLRGLSSQV